MRKKIILLPGLLFYVTTVVLAQKNSFFANSNGYQYGAAIKASFEFAENTKLTFRLGVSGGIGGFVAGNTVYPSLHADLMFYNNGLGSPKNRKLTPKIVTDFLLAGTITAGWRNRMKTISSIKPGIRNYPLYYFGNFNRTPLQNPFNYSFSLGSNLAICPSHKHPVQQVGFLNAHIGQFQFSYFNDGTPFQFIALGDGRDRYYTGGGILSYTLASKYDFDIFEFCYYKYSGYTPHAFEIANLLDFSFLNYGEDEQNNYNKSVLSFTARSSTHRYAFSLKAFNQTDWDIQHIIHRYIFNAYHRVPHKAYITPEFSYYFSETKIGLQ